MYVQKRQTWKCIDHQVACEISWKTERKPKCCTNSVCLYSEDLPSKYASGFLSLDGYQQVAFYVDERVNAGSCCITLQSLPKHFMQWRRLWNTLFLKKKKNTQIKLWNLCKKTKNKQTAVYSGSVTQFVVTSLRIEDVHCCALFCVTQWVYHGGDGTAFSTVACFSDESCTVTLAGCIRMESFHSKQCHIDELDPFGFSVLKDVFLFLCLSNLSNQRIVLLQFNPWNIMIHQLQRTLHNRTLQSKQVVTVARKKENTWADPDSDARTILSWLRPRT